MAYCVSSSFVFCRLPHGSRSNGKSSKKTSDRTSGEKQQRKQRVGEECVVFEESVVSEERVSFGGGGQETGEVSSKSEAAARAAKAPVARAATGAVGRAAEVAS